MPARHAATTHRRGSVILIGPYRRAVAVPEVVAKDIRRGGLTCAFDVLLHGLKKDHLWNSFIVLAHVLVVFWSELQQVGIWSLAESVAESVESISQNLKSLHAWQIEQQALYVVSLLISL